VRTIGCGLVPVASRVRAAPVLLLAGTIRTCARCSVRAKVPSKSNTTNAGSRRREALIECGDRWSRSLVGRTCSRERSTGSNDSGGQFDKCVVENGVCVLKSGQTKLNKVIVLYLIEYGF
jgi:hypothetical protein